MYSMREIFVVESVRPEPRTSLIRISGPTNLATRSIGYIYKTSRVNLEYKIYQNIFSPNPSIIFYVFG